MPSHGSLAAALLFVSARTCAALVVARDQAVQTSGNRSGADGVLARRGGDPTWDKKSLQESSKYAKDYPKDDNNVAPTKTATSQASVAPVATGKPAASADASSSKSADTWYEEEAAKINKDCKEKHDRLKELRVRKAKQDVDKAEEKLEKEHMEMAEAEEILKKEEEDVQKQEDEVKKEEKEMEEDEAKAADATEKVDDKKAKVKSLRKLIEEKKECVEELKQLEQEARAEKRDVATAEQHVVKRMRAVDAQAAEVKSERQALHEEEETHAAATAIAESSQKDVRAAKTEVRQAEKELADARSHATAAARTMTLATASVIAIAAFLRM